MEITYDTGAKVILQGPVTYEVESKAGGYLSLGKLTARVEQEARGQSSGSENQKSKIRNQKLFVVRTPTAVVTDLGTEFGMDVDRKGRTRSHVFRGRVRVQRLAADRKPQGDGQLLNENESACVEYDKDKDGSMPVVVDPSFKPTGFVREIPKQTIKTLDLVDMVAGGDGFGKARGRGVDPVSGKIVDQPPRTDGWDQIRDDGQYHVVEGLPFVDGVFVPDDRKGPVQLDSVGHTFAFFGVSDDRVFGYIWAGGQIPAPLTPLMQTQVGDIDYASSDHGCLGMESNKGITFDLAAIRRAHPDCKILRFSAVAASTYPRSSEGQWCSADIRVFIDGQVRVSKLNVNTSNGVLPIPITLEIGDNDRFLTLVVSDAGNTIVSDRILIGDPRLELMMHAVSGLSAREGTIP
jgi:hypothetical protein